MSLVRFFPIHWFEDDNWESIQVIGRLENGHSIYIRIAFYPYFTVRYSESYSLESINSDHSYLLSKTPIIEIKHLENKTYRMSVLNKPDYYSSINFYQKNSVGQIIDEEQDVKSKFFSERKISPGLWQQASDLQSLIFNVTNNTRYTTADLEYYTQTIKSIDYNSPIPLYTVIFFDVNSALDENQCQEGISNINIVISHNNTCRTLNYIISGKQDSLVDKIPVSSEKELLESFYSILTEYRPDRIVSINGINLLCIRSRALNVKIPSFSKILSYTPYIYPQNVTNKYPFSSINEIWKLHAPGISQINLSDFYYRVYPHLNDYNIQTIIQYVLGTMKIDINASLIKKLWDFSNVESSLIQMANFWKNDPEHVLNNNPDRLFDDLVRCLTWDFPKKKCSLVNEPITHNIKGIHRNIYLYSLSNLYLLFLEQSGSPFANVIAQYFKGTNGGIIPFRSGYFNTSFTDIHNFINEHAPHYLWIDNYVIAMNNDYGSQNWLLPIDYIPLLISSGDSSIIINKNNVILKKGLSPLVKPPFMLIEKYINYLISFLSTSQDHKINFPKFENTIDDFILETKITMSDFRNSRTQSDSGFYDSNKLKRAILEQLIELDLWKCSCITVRYIQTIYGPVIEPIYLKDSNRYVSKIDLQYYNTILQNTLQSIL